MIHSNLKLNECKSEFMLLGSKGMLGKVTKPCFKIDDVELEPKESCRNLGVIFDANMTFHNHISHVAKSVRYQLRNLSHIRKFLSRRATEQIVHSLISSRLDFCNAILNNIPEYQLKRLQRLQNSAARLVTLTKGSSHISPILKELHWLPVHARIDFRIILFVYQSLHGTAPTYIQDLIHRHAPPRQLRSSHTNLLHIPRTHHTWGTRSFSHIGPSLWNALPLQIRQESTYTHFKTLLKTHLFS